MIRVYGLNVDAFKASKPVAFFRQMENEQVDIICVQETGRPTEMFPPYALLDGYHVAASYDADAPGRTGVAIFSRHPIQSSASTLCGHSSCQGRFVEATIGGLKVASVYAHAHDAKNADRRTARIRFNACLGDYMRRNRSERCIVVLDANVSLTRQDVTTQTQWSGPWASPTYRSPITQAMQDAGWADSYRIVHSDRRRATVWVPANFSTSDGGEAGYGIDFHLISHPIIPTVRSAEIFKPRTWAERFSDHAPTLGVYDIALN